MKKIISTVLSSVIVVSLIVLSLVFSDYSLSNNQTAALNVLLIVCVSSIAYCFIVGEITQNFSQMDKLWSVLPVAYAWIVAGMGGMKTRLVVYALIVTAWGIRLTINFARKGAYSIKFWTGKEDYRWSIVRSNKIFQNRFAWMAFDLFFISFYQNALVLAITFPALACMESVSPFGVWDIVAIVLSIAFLTLETISDEYQWRFHQKKRALLAEAGSLDAIDSPYNLGFNTTGPWGYMRHPNYLGEQGIWMSLFVFAIAAEATSYFVFHWTMVGPLLLILLFMGSSTLGEAISSKKYPKYKEYASVVHKYVPLRRFKTE